MIKRIREIILINPKGFSLVEILIALSILAVGLLGIASIIPIGGAKIHDAQMNDKALELAKLGIEKARAFALENLNYTNLNVACAGAGTPYEGFGCIQDYPEFSREYIVYGATDSQGNPIPNVKMVTVIVTFRTKMKSNATDIGEKQVFLVDYIGEAFKVRLR